MSKVHTACDVGIGECAGRGHGAASRVAGLFALAATPVFAAMAVWTGWFASQPGMLCLGLQGPSPMRGMTVMYALMSVFHVPPWLKWISNR